MAPHRAASGVAQQQQRPSPTDAVFCSQLWRAVGLDPKPSLCGSLGAGAEQQAADTGCRGGRGGAASTSSSAPAWASAHAPPSWRAWPSYTVIDTLVRRSGQQAADPHHQGPDQPSSASKKPRASVAGVAATGRIKVRLPAFAASQRATAAASGSQQQQQPHARPPAAPNSSSSALLGPGPHQHHHPSPASSDGVPNTAAADHTADASSPPPSPLHSSSSPDLADLVRQCPRRPRRPSRREPRRDLAAFGESFASLALSGSAGGATSVLRVKRPSSEMSHPAAQPTAPHSDDEVEEEEAPQALPSSMPAGWTASVRTGSRQGHQKAQQQQQPTQQQKQPHSASAGAAPGTTTGPSSSSPANSVSQQSGASSDIIIKARPWSPSSPLSDGVF